MKISNKIEFFVFCCFVFVALFFALYIRAAALFLFQSHEMTILPFFPKIVFEYWILWIILIVFPFVLCLWARFSGTEGPFFKISFWITQFLGLCYVGFSGVAGLLIFAISI